MLSSLFGRKTIDENKVNEFVSWFMDNRERIRSSVENRETDGHEMMRMIDEVEAHLAAVYRDGYRGNIEFDYGGEGHAWELNLYHMGKPYLIIATQMIADRINNMDSCGWTVKTGK